jgi:mevalonate kinase
MSDWTDFNPRLDYIDQLHEERGERVAEALLAQKRGDTETYWRQMNIAHQLTKQLRAIESDEQVDYQEEV